VHKEPRTVISIQILGIGKPFLWRRSPPRVEVDYWANHKRDNKLSVIESFAVLYMVNLHTVLTVGRRTHVS
jgi:hypothetical protein